LGFKVQGLGFELQGLGCRFSGFRGRGLEFIDYLAGCTCLGSRVLVQGFRVWGLGFRLRALGFVLGFGGWGFMV